MVIDYRSINYKLLKQNKSVYIPVWYIEHFKYGLVKCLLCVFIGLMINRCHVINTLI